MTRGHILHFESKKNKQKISISIQCYCATAGHSTFSVFHNTDYSVVAGVLDEHPVTARTVRWVVSESLLHRHVGVLLAITTGTAACTGWDAVSVNLWELLFSSDAYSGSVSDIFFLLFLNIHLALFSPPFFPCHIRESILSLFWPALVKSMPAGYAVKGCHSPYRKLYGGRFSTKTCPVMCAMLTALNTIH